jgi:hypothetical protein
MRACLSALASVRTSRFVTSAKMADPTCVRRTTMEPFASHLDCTQNSSCNAGIGLDVALGRMRRW